MTQTPTATPSEKAEAANAKAERPEVKAPEANDNLPPQAATDRPPIKIPEAQTGQPPQIPVSEVKTPKPVTAAVAPTESLNTSHVQKASISDNLIVFPSVMSKAQENLATYIAQTFDGILEPTAKQAWKESGMRLVLSNEVSAVPSESRHPHTSLVIELSGALAKDNAVLFGAHTIEALLRTSNFEGLHDLKHAPQTRTEAKTGTLQIVVPHLTTAQYAHLLQSLATGVALKTPEAANDLALQEKTTAHDCSGAGCANCHAQAAAHGSPSPAVSVPVAEHGTALPAPAQAAGAAR